MDSTRDSFIHPLRDALHGWSLMLAPQEEQSLYDHYQAMVEANRRVNLTRITDPQEAAIKHYADSLAMLKWSTERNLSISRVLDIGGGAGFPSLPLAICASHGHVTVVEATLKKTRFLSQVCSALSLSNVAVEHAHSHHWRPQRRFDFVVFRAVGNLENVLPDACRLAGHEKWIIAYKGPKFDHMERGQVDSVISTLPLTFSEEYHYTLPFKGETLTRTLQIYRRS